MKPGARVLLAEDDAMLQALVACVLEERAGWRVTAVEAAPEVLSAVHATAPDLLLLDYRLKGGTAEDVLRSLRADPDAARVPVLVLTGERDPKVLERFASLGAIGVLSKPFEVGALPGQIRAILARGGRPAPSNGSAP